LSWNNETSNYSRIFALKRKSAFPWNELRWYRDYSSLRVILKAFFMKGEY